MLQGGFNFETARPAPAPDACAKCGGSGRFMSFRGRDCGPCFTCNGTGRKTTRAPALAPVELNAKGLDRLKDAFDRAASARLRRPVMWFEGFEASMASASGRNPGAIYAKAHTGEYLGKIQGGAFFASRDCTGEQSAMIAQAMDDPIAAALAYAKRSGRCCVCNATLTEGKSVAAGMGPVCRKRFAIWHGLRASDPRLVA